MEKRERGEDERLPAGDGPARDPRDDEDDEDASDAYEPCYRDGSLRNECWRGEE